MENHDFWCMDKKFEQVLSPQEVKNTLKMTSLPLIPHTERSLGRLRFWRRKWAENSEIPLGLEIRQPRLSKKHTWEHFRLLEVPQNKLQSGVVHIESGAAHIGKKANFTSISRNFDSRLLQVGPIIYISVFQHLRWHSKYFHSRLASIQVAKEGKSSPKPFVMFVTLHLQLMVGFPAPFYNDLSNSPTLGSSISSWHILYIVCKLFARGWLACNFQETVGEKLSSSLYILTVD